MSEEQAFQIVLNKLKECELFCGKYDGKHGSQQFMHGIGTVMEVIAYHAGDEQFEDMFIRNLIMSEDKEK